MISDLFRIFSENVLLCSSNSGLAIYFCYGIHHSSEAALGHPCIETEMNGFKLSHELDAMLTEKEAFLHDGIDVREEHDGDL